jgi:hypothetical protein
LPKIPETIYLPTPHHPLRDCRLISIVRLSILEIE